MISREETGLTQEQYDAIVAGQGYIAKRVTLRRRNLDFSQHDTFASTSGYNLDVFLDDDDLIYRAQNVDGTLQCWTLDSEDAGDTTWTAVTDIDTDIDNVRPSFDQNGAVFYVKGGNIYRATTADYGNTWSTAQIIDLSAESISGTITHIAAAGDGNIFFAVYRSDYNTVIYKSQDPFGTGYIYNSDIYLPHKLTGMDAKNIPTGLASKDRNLIVISVEMPVQIATKASITSTEVVGIKREGLLAFINTNQRWSEHFVIEQFDDATDYQKRRYPFLSRVTLESGQEVFVCSSYGVDGNENYHNSAIHFSISPDGKYWSQHELVTVDGQSYSGIFLPRGQYTYLCSAQYTHRSYTTEILGTPASAVQEDISDRVLKWTASHDTGRASSIVLSNADGWLDGSLLGSDGLFSIKTELGLYLSNSPVMFPFSIEYVDTWEQEKATPRSNISVKTRDNIARLTSEVHSSSAVLTDNQTIGADNFVDPTDTDYGGMGHTEPLVGSWKTTGDHLVLLSNNKRGAAATTFKIDVWNGVIEASFQITEAGSGQFAGLVFRAYDKANFYSAEYRYGTGKLHLYEIRGGKKTELESVALSWTLGTKYWLRVTYRYSHVIVETSLSGRSWTPQIDTITPGKNPDSGVSYLESADVEAMLEEGSCGVTGRGYAPDEQWSPDPLIPDDWTWDYEDYGDDDFDGEVTPPPVADPPPTGGGTGDHSAIIALNVTRDVDPYPVRGMVAYTRDLLDATGWKVLQSGLPVSDYYGVDPLIYINLDPFNTDHAVAFMLNGGIYHNAAWKDGASWTTLVTPAQMLAAVQAQFPTISEISVRDATFSVAQANLYYLAIQEYDSATCDNVTDALDSDIVVVRVSGSTIQVCPYRFGFESYPDDPPRRWPSISPSYYDPDKFWMAGRVSSGNGGYRFAGWWKQTWGSWTNISGGRIVEHALMADAISGHNQFIWSAFLKEDGTPNSDDSEVYLMPTDGYIWKSIDGGNTFNQWTASGVHPKIDYPDLSVDGARKDNFSVGPLTAQEEKAYFINAFTTSIDGPGLYVLPRDLSAITPSHWTYKAFPTDMGNNVGFVNGWPFSASQYYIGIGAPGRVIRPDGVDGKPWTVAMISDLNEDWQDLTGNLHLLLPFYGGAGNKYRYVVRMTPDYVEAW